MSRVRSVVDCTSPKRPLSASVQPLETNPNPENRFAAFLADKPSDLGEAWRHSGWRRLRNRVYASLRRTNQSVSRVMAFVNCGTSSHIYRTMDPPYEYRIGGSSCHDRFCIPCAKDRSRLIADNVHTLLGDDAARFLTLTLKHDGSPLGQRLDRLYSCFTHLRTLALWRRRVDGGCAMTEVVWSCKTGDWHLHLHCLLHGRYLHHADIARAWKKVTGDSWVIDIRAVKTKAAITKYLTKYLAKTALVDCVADDDLMDELVLAYRNRRLCLTFGTWRGSPLTEMKSDRQWLSLGSLDDFLDRAGRDDAQALHILAVVCGDRFSDLLDAKMSASRPPPIVRAISRTEPLFPWASIGFGF